MAQVGWRQARLAVGYLFLLMGWFTLLMAISFYWFIGGNGLHSLGYMPRAPLGHDWEESLSYFAAVAYLAGVQTMWYYVRA